MPTLSFENMERVRRQVNQREEQRIRRLYTQAANNVANKASYLATFGDSNDGVAAAFLKNQIVQPLDASIDNIARALEGYSPEAMRAISNAAVEDVTAWATSAGMQIGTAYAYVPHEVVESLVTGQVYGGGWNLSGAIWGDNDKTKRDIYEIVARGTAENKSSYAIAKDLEKYVRPGAAKPWDWSKVYPGTKKSIDYNAQRLARTLRSHATQLSFVRTTVNNPFVTAYRWESALAHGRTCEVCYELDGQLFEKDALPVDHPNGLCTWTAEIPYSMNEVADMIGDWYHGEGDPEMNEKLDTFYADMRGENVGQNDLFINTDTGVVGKTRQNT